MIKIKNIGQITRSLLIDAGVFGVGRQVDEHNAVVDFKGKTYTFRNSRDRDIYERDMWIAFEDWKSANKLTICAAFIRAVKEYGERFPGWRSPQGRPFPDHYFRSADAEARLIMREAGIV